MGTVYPVGMIHVRNGPRAPQYPVIASGRQSKRLKGLLKELFFRFSQFAENPDVFCTHFRVKVDPHILKPFFLYLKSISNPASYGLRVLTGGIIVSQILIGQAFHIADYVYSVKYGAADTGEIISYGSFFAGGNATLAWTPFGGKFSFYGSATACYNFPGIVNSELETKYEPMDGSEASTTKYSDMKKVFGTVRIIPAVGISWRF